MRRTGCLAGKRMERMSIARLAGSTILISTCRSPPSGRNYYAQRAMKINQSIG